VGDVYEDSRADVLLLEIYDVLETALVQSFDHRALELSTRSIRTSVGALIARPPIEPLPVVSPGRLPCAP
jgi:hypothetical protein